MVKKLRRFTRELLEVFPNLQPPLPQDSEQLTCNIKLQGKRGGKEREVSPSEVLQSYLFTFDYSNGLQSGKRTVVLRKLLSRSDDLIGQGPIVVEVRCDCQGCDWKGSDGRCNWVDLDLVMKISFPKAGRAPEDKIIRELLNLAINQHAWALNHLPKLLCSFTVHFGGIQKRLKMELGDEIYEEQVIRGSIQEKIFPIGQVKSDFEEAQVVYDAFQCHEWVHDIGRILHRDISMNNLMFRRIDGEVYGVLNDFDLATGIDDLDRTPTSKHRAGTRPFMAHEQHSDKWNGPPRYRHDAESFFYLILMLGCNYSKPGTKVENAPYGSWFDAGDQHLYLSKRVLYTEGVFLPPTKRSGYEEWGRQIQRLLIRGFNARLSFELDRDNEPDGGSFNQDTLGGHFTADKLREVLSRFDNRIVISRDPAKLYLNFPS